MSLCLGNWLPGLNVRPLIPGDVLGIIAGTGQLKSAAAQNILACNPRMPALFCQLEISGPLMFERGAAIATGIDTTEVHRRYREGDRVDWRSGGKMSNLLVSTRSMNMKQIDELISRSSAKLGSVPRVVVIDYIQLIKGEGTRYERVSEACEETKRLAKKWNLIAVILSQISRKNRNDANTEEEIREVSLYDAKGIRQLRELVQRASRDVENFDDRHEVPSSQKHKGPCGQHRRNEDPRRHLHH